MANRKGKGGSSDRFPVLGLQNHCGWWLQPWKKKMIASWQESNDKPRQCIEKQRHYSAGKGPYGQGYGLPNGHEQLWELDREKGRTPKNWCLQTMVLKKAPESPLDSKEIKPVNLKGDQPWIFIGRTDADAEAPILWPPDAKSWPLGKDPVAGKDWRQEEKGMTEDEMVEWHHQLDGVTSGVADGQGSLVCYSPWGSQRVRHDWATELNWTHAPYSCVYNSEHPGSIPVSGRSPGEENGTHFIILAWKIPWTEQPGRLQFMGLQRVRYNWATLLSLSFTLMCSRLITKDH